MSDVYLNYVPRHDHGRVWEIFHFNLQSTVYLTEFLFIFYVFQNSSIYSFPWCQFFDSLSRKILTANANKPLMFTFQALSGFTTTFLIMNLLKKIDLKCDKSFQEQSQHCDDGVSAKKHHLFWKCAKQTFNVIRSGMCFPCLSRARFVPGVSSRERAEEWPFSSLMLLHYGMTSGWASERIFTGLLLISL